MVISLKGSGDQAAQAAAAAKGAKLRAIMVQPDRDVLADVATRLQDGALRVEIALEFALPEIARPHEAKLRRAEVEKVWELIVAGTLRSINFFSGEGRGAVLHLESPDRSSAEAAVQSLPMVGAGLLRSEILSLAPFTSLAELFTKQPAP